MGQPWSLFHLFLFFSHKQYKFYNKLLLLLMFQRYEKTFISFAIFQTNNTIFDSQLLGKNVHPVSSAGIRTHNLLNTSLLL